MSYLKLFSMPNPVKITGRSSSITNSFVNSIIPIVTPTESQVQEALNILGMDSKSLQCAYCGDRHTEWDHLRPIVKDKKPTGYISEIHNLVPACGKCNQSKGNKDWNIWIVSSAMKSPKSRGIEDLDSRVVRIKAFESWRVPTKVDFESIVGTEKWQRHWENCEAVQSSMRQAQLLAEKIRQEVAKYYNCGNTSESTATNKITRAHSSRANSDKFDSGREHYVIKYENEYRNFIESRGVGSNDKVASSVDSYVSYLNSVSKILSKDITPELLASESDVEEICTELYGKRADSTIGKYKSAMNQYTTFVHTLGKNQTR